jgi:hypothetical protein
MTVASFFQDDTESALISQVQWLQKELDISDRFFSNLLKVEEKAFSRWRTRKETLPEDTQDHLKEFWRMTLHILSFLNFDLKLAQMMLEHKDESKVRSVKLAFDPPWIGTSMKAYLETNGPVGIQKVDQWVQAVRFADSY